MFAKLDAYRNMELARTHGIRSFPTIKYFPKELKDDEVHVDFVGVVALSFPFLILENSHLRRAAN